MTTNDGCRADVRKARAEAAGVDPTAAAVRAAQAEALREAADDFARQWPTYGDDWLRDRADRLACCDGASQESASGTSDAHTDTAAPERDCLAGPACVRLTTDGCRPVCGFAPGEFEDRVSEWSPVEPETSEPEGGESR